MTDRTAELEAAVRAQDALIAEAQCLLTDYLSKRTESASLLMACSRCLTDPASARRDGLCGKRWARNRKALRSHASDRRGPDPYRAQWFASKSPPSPSQPSPSLSLRHLRPALRATRQALRKPISNAC